MKTQDITVDFAAPIPVGHKVVVIQYKRKEKVLPGHWIMDVDTGIEYGLDFQYEDRSNVNFNKPTVWPLDVRTDLEVDTKIEGYIRRCRVMTMRWNMNWQMQTRLQIEQTD